MNRRVIVVLVVCACAFSVGRDAVSVFFALYQYARTPDGSAVVSLTNLVITGAAFLLSASRR